MLAPHSPAWTRIANLLPRSVTQVATISANGDAAIGQLIADGFDKVGKDGVMTVKDGQTTEDTLEVTEGMKFDRGYISPFFINQQKGRIVMYENSVVLISQKKISTVQAILPALEMSHSTKRYVAHSVPPTHPLAFLSPSMWLSVARTVFAGGRTSRIRCFSLSVVFFILLCTYLDADASAFAAALVLNRALY
jgi:hypothetical protein